MTKRILLGGLIAMAASTSLFAGGDNRVSMTDMKEALYNLVIASEKSEAKIASIDERVKKIEPITSNVDNNSKNISMIIGRLNQLGAITSSQQSADVNDEITNFIAQNKQMLPLSMQGVK